MTQYQLTLDSETLQRLFTGDGQIARLLEAVLNQVLNAQVTEQLQAAPYERSEQRQGYRNGYKPRQLTTRVGALTLLVPQVRDGQFSTELFARYQRSEQALVLALMEMVVNGVSTRKVARITEELCGTSFAKSTVSDLCKALDPLVAGWNERDLSAHRYPFVLVDALVVKVREAGRVRAVSALVATGVNEHGYREVLGLRLGDSESERTWMECFTWLKGRSLTGVDLVVSDHHGGLVNAVRVQFQGATWQRCQTHLSANIADATPKALQEEVHARLRPIFDAPDETTARTLLASFVSDYQTKAPAAVATLERGFDDATAVLALPTPYRKRVRTTNGVERLNEEIRRRERVIRIFPNRDSVIRLVGALLMEQDEVWTTGRRYFDMTEFWQWRECLPRQAPLFQEVPMPHSA
ncbi:MAG TPA: IS256 family transposase [Ktedonobacterales bacterium]|nr:IS256 family transposase [Ktedonobacterales bacterium]